MKVAVPKVMPDGRRMLFQPDNEEDSMQSKLKAGYIQDMFLLINKPPKWNDQVRCSAFCPCLSSRPWPRLAHIHHTCFE